VQDFLVDLISACVFMWVVVSGFAVLVRLIK
jgi:hypothetical protein